MKKWKWTLLVISGGVLVQLSGCASTILAILADTLVRQVLSRLLSGATQTAT